MKMAEIKTWRGTHKKHGSVKVDLTDAEKASYEIDPQTKGKYRFEPIPQPKSPIESKPAVPTAPAKQ